MLVYSATGRMYRTAPTSHNVKP
ncbi:hypothetical protein F383_33160 [Gossypium arboreum]|uniref:Uncharacterized protein n=1 Tax=Gossypium arboreum TaxID=29729 RepID=A0A0B0N6U9_GOSAR|nr:hypothetical protein F383_33160 [Gossypium arboreum]